VTGHDDDGEVGLGGRKFLQQLEAAYSPAYFPVPPSSTALAEVKAQMIAEVPQKDWGGRSLDEISSLSYPLVESVGATAAE
jgi:hypothetical protein